MNPPGHDRAVEWLGAFIHARAGDTDLAPGIGAAIRDTPESELRDVVIELLGLAASVIRSVGALAGADPVLLFQEMALALARDDDLPTE